MQFVVPSRTSLICIEPTGASKATSFSSLSHRRLSLRPPRAPPCLAVSRRRRTQRVVVVSHSRLQIQPSVVLPLVLLLNGENWISSSIRLTQVLVYREGSMAKKPGPRPSKLSVYLYLPNIIGYVRVLINCVAFYLCFTNKLLFSLLYFFSFVCDAVDGWCARKFNQVSTFGAVLDMVTDRISTACLLVILSQVYKPGLIFLSLLALDIASHWMQMYSTFLLGKASHKDVKDSTNWLFKAYYGNRMFMAYCCVSCEVLYLLLFFLSENQTDKLMEVLTSSLQKISIISFLVATTLFGWAIKQIVNIIQLKTAADVCVLHDIEKKQKQ